MTLDILEKLAPSRTILADKREESHMRQRWESILAFKGRFRSVMNSTGFAYDSKTQMILDWLDKTEETDEDSNLNNMKTREEYIEKSGIQIVEEGEQLHSKFMHLLQKAVPYISEASKQRWIQRLYDTSEISITESSFSIKFKWVREEMEAYVDRWIEVAEARDTLMENSAINELINADPELRKMKNREEFLNLHFNEKKRVIARANILMESMGKQQDDLYDKVKTDLNKAVRSKVLAQHKVGTWLNRINNKATRKQREEFLKPGKNSLPELIKNWTEVKKRYDLVVKKLRQQKGNVKTRGFNLVSETVFLDMHYDQRLKYVKEAEHRLHDSKDANKERPEFLQIRHALDMRDWEEAEEQIAKTEKIEDLSDADSTRLKSMKQFLARMRDDTAKKGEKKGQAEEFKNAKQTIGRAFASVPSNIKSLVTRLLKSPHANRNIHQLRWIAYNNKWCRDNNYLSQEKMRFGANKMNRKLTKFRGDHGLDIGMHDNLTDETAKSNYLRDEQIARRKPTIYHLDARSGSAQNLLARRMEMERHPRELYWTTLAINEDGLPMSNQYHDDLLMTLTELRQATKVLEKYGYMFGGEGLPLVPFAHGTKSAIMN